MGPAPACGAGGGSLISHPAPATRLVSHGNGAPGRGSSPQRLPVDRSGRLPSGAGPVATRFDRRRVGRVSGPGSADRRTLAPPDPGTVTGCPVPGPAHPAAAHPAPGTVSAVVVRAPAPEARVLDHPAREETGSASRPVRDPAGGRPPDPWPARERTSPVVLPTLGGRDHITRTIRPRSPVTGCPSRGKRVQGAKVSVRCGRRGRRRGRPWGVDRGR